MSKHPIPMLARFNAWANEQIYDACATLTDADRKADRGAFFGSIHNTLNHLLVVDRGWFGRLEGVDRGIRSLDQILYDDFDALRAARREEDQHLIELVDSLDDTRLAEVIHYRLISGEEGATRCDLMLITVFNHQTHHRGQIHNMLSQAGVKTPEMDIIQFPGHAD